MIACGDSWTCTSQSTTSMSSSLSLRSLVCVAASAKIPPWSYLAHHPSAVDADGLARYEGGRVGGEKRDEVADVFGRSAALDALLLEHPAVVAFLVGVDLLGVRGEGARRYGVDVDVVRADLAGERARKADYTSFRGNVVEQERPPDKEGDRGHVHDVAPSLLLHMRIDGPRAQEVAFEVNGHHPVPFCFFDLRPRPPRVDSGVIDEDVHTAEPARNFIGHGPDRTAVRDVSLHGHDAGAIRSDLVCDPLRLLAGDVDRGDGRAVRGEPRADALGEASAPTRYDSDPTLQRTSHENQPPRLTTRPLPADDDIHLIGPQQESRSPGRGSGDSRASRKLQDLNSRRTRTEARTVEVAVVAPLRNASMASSLIPRSSGISMSLSVMYWVMR